MMQEIVWCLILIKNEQQTPLTCKTFECLNNFMFKIHAHFVHDVLYLNHSSWLFIQYFFLANSCATDFDKDCSM